MRMWGIDVTKMCNQHLLGEHSEMHMFIGTITKGISIKGYIENKLVDPTLIITRHDIIASEMLNRHMNHHSPLKSCPEIGLFTLSSLDVQLNAEELAARCPRCATLMGEEGDDIDGSYLGEN